MEQKCLNSNYSQQQTCQAAVESELKQLLSTDTESIWAKKSPKNKNFGPFAMSSHVNLNE